MNRGFASDNAATVHPEVLAAIVGANAGHAFGYGHDELTRALEGRFREHFGERARGYPVWGGTAANVLSLRATCRPWEAVICAETAHLYLDECGAPEAIAAVPPHTGYPRARSPKCSRKRPSSARVNSSCP